MSISDHDLHEFFKRRFPVLNQETKELLELYHRYRSLNERPMDEAFVRATFPTTLNQDLFERIPPELQNRSTEWIGWIPLFRNHVLGSFSVLGDGGPQKVSFALRPFITELLRVNPAGFYLFHNHPSQDLTPSKEDLRLTRSLSPLCRSLDIPLFGHGIIGLRRIRWIMLRYPKHENGNPDCLHGSPRLRKLRKAE